MEGALIDGSQLDGQHGGHAIRDTVQAAISHAHVAPCAMLLQDLTLSSSPITSLGAMTQQHTLLQPLDALLQHTATDADEDAAPMMLVEESLACAADFLLLHTIKAQLGANASTTATVAASASPVAPAAATAAPVASRGPAVVLCHFKHAAAHYTQIARKWVSAASQCSALQRAVRVGVRTVQTEDAN